MMTQKEFQTSIEKYSTQIDEIKQSAHQLHAHVNQTYDKIHPYGLHLDMVVDSVYQYGHAVCADEKDVLPLFFGAYYHDSIEDARQTYNDVKRTALQWMDEQQAYMAAEIVYALTNDKGRTRAERAGEKYYQGIRETPYAPFVKLADRLANISYSSGLCPKRLASRTMTSGLCPKRLASRTMTFSHANEANIHMKRVYQQELPHFLKAITATSNDLRFSLPQAMIERIKQVAEGEAEKS